MKLVMTLLVRDEADIIGDMLAYHRQTDIDHVVAMDNGSTDGTTEILRDFAEEGWLTLLHEPSDGYRQDTWVSEMARFAVLVLGADWIICSDTDEFWMPPAGQGLKQAIAQAFETTGADMLAASRLNLMGAEGDAPWHERLLYTPATPQPLRWSDPMRDSLADPYFYYSVPDKVILRGEGLLAVGRGAHTATYRTPPKSGSSSVEVHHVPVRSRDEFEGSVRQIGGAVRADGSLDPRVSGKYRRWLAMTERTGSIEAAWAEVMPSPSRLEEDLKSGKLTEAPRLRSVLRKQHKTGSPPARGTRAAPNQPAPLDPASLAQVALVTGFLPEHTEELSRLLRQKAGLPEQKAQGPWQAATLELLQRQIALDPPEAPDSEAARPLRADLLGRALAPQPGSERLVVGTPYTDAALPLWSALSRELPLDLRIALVFVDPVRAAQDLQVAHGISPEIGLLVWLDHITRLERHSRGHPRVFLPLPPAGTALGPATERLRRGLGLTWHEETEGFEGAAWARGPATRFEVHASPEVPKICKKMLATLDAAARSEAPESLQPSFDAIAEEQANLPQLLPGLARYRLSPALR